MSFDLDTYKIKHDLVWLFSGGGVEDGKRNRESLQDLAIFYVWSL